VPSWSSSPEAAATTTSSIVHCNCFIAIADAVNVPPSPDRAQSWQHLLGQQQQHQHMISPWL
jgi:hypothetical protein